ncbi:FtsB family cell division protein [Paratractidigestivibacter sp.]|uniref:FtsB family cell division protein n=1 Tax=Paratractidigestivibacter sp. TaxID=2847316 RepID=UPI004026CC5A
MSETTDNYSNGRHARLSGAEARAAADAARAAREGSHFTSAPAQPEQGFSYGDAARGAAAAGTADIAGNAWAVGTGGVPGDSGTVADAGFADAAAPRRPRSSRLDDRGTQRANRRRDARVAPDRAADGRPAEPRREAASLPTIDVNGALSAIGNFVVHFRVALLIAALVLGVLMAMYGPVQTYYRAWRAGQDLQAQLDELNASNEQYKDDIQALQTREGIEDEARRRGYVTNGETKVVVDGLNDGSDDSSQSSDGDQQAQKPWYIELGDKVFHYIGN